jgi:hypothetical protein
MTPKEKALRLLVSYFAITDNLKQQKQCALVAVDEILSIAQYECHIQRPYNPHETVEYWTEVKQEIEKL